MRVRHAEETLNVRDRPGCFWLFGLLFLLPGAVFFAGPLGLFTDAHAQPVWVRALFMGMGAVAMAVGMYVIVSSPASTLVLDRRSGEGEVRRRSVLGRTVERFPFAELLSADVDTRKDSEGDPTYQVRVRMRDGTPLPISRLWMHDRRAADEAVEAIRAFARDDPRAQSGVTRAPRSSS